MTWSQVNRQIQPNSFPVMHLAFSPAWLERRRRSAKAMQHPGFGPQGNVEQRVEYPANLVSR